LVEVNPLHDVIFPFNGNNRHAHQVLLGEHDGARSLVPDVAPFGRGRTAAQEGEKKVKNFKTAAVALLSGLLIGAASMPARPATVEDKATVVEKMPTKGGAPSPLGVRSPVEESRTAFRLSAGPNELQAFEALLKRRRERPRELHHGWSSEYRLGSMSAWVGR
jgi:hypothetical protein